MILHRFFFHNKQKSSKNRANSLYFAEKKVT